MGLRDGISEARIDVGNIASGASAEVDTDAAVFSEKVDLKKLFVNVGADFTARANSNANILLKAGTVTVATISFGTTGSGGTGDMTAPDWTDVSSKLSSTASVGIAANTNLKVFTSTNGNGQAMTGVNLRIVADPVL